MKVNGFLEKEMEMDDKNGQIVQIMRDNGRRTKVVVGEN